MHSRMPVRAKRCSWRVPHMTQAGRGVQTATSAGWESSTWNPCAQAGKPGWISHSAQFPSLLFLTGTASSPAWADVLTEWGLLKALLDDKEKLWVSHCTCRCSGLSQMLALLLKHQNQQITLDKPVVSSKFVQGLHCPHMTKCRICSAYNLNCWGPQFKCKDEIPMFHISFAESTLKAGTLRQAF